MLIIFKYAHVSREYHESFLLSNNYRTVENALFDKFLMDVHNWRTYFTLYIVFVVSHFLIFTFKELPILLNHHHIIHFHFHLKSQQIKNSIQIKILLHHFLLLSGHILKKFS